MSHDADLKGTSHKEIEIKAMLDQQDFFRLRHVLPSVSNFIGKNKEEDIYLNNPENSFIFINQKGFKDANDYLRIRKSKDGVSGMLCFKKVHRKNDIVYCDEYETFVANYREALQIFENLGYTERSYVTKMREQYRYGDYEISLDELEQLGYFVEVEIKEHSYAVSEGLAAIESFMREQLDLSDYKKQTHGYLSMIWNLSYDFSVPSS